MQCWWVQNRVVLGSLWVGERWQGKYSYPPPPPRVLYSSQLPRVEFKAVAAQGFPLCCDHRRQGVQWLILPLLGGNISSQPAAGCPAQLATSSASLFLSHCVCVFCLFVPNFCLSIPGNIVLPLFLPIPEEVVSHFATWNPPIHNFKSIVFPFPKLNRQVRWIS